MFLVSLGHFAKQHRKKICDVSGGQRKTQKLAASAGGDNHSGNSAKSINRQEAPEMGQEDKICSSVIHQPAFCRPSKPRAANAAKTNCFLCRMPA